MPRRPDATSDLLHAYSASARVNQYLVEQLHPDVWPTTGVRSWTGPGAGHPLSRRAMAGMWQWTARAKE